MHISYNKNISLASDAFISLSKPQKVLELVVNTDYDTLIQSLPAHPAQLYAVHERAFVDDTIALRRENGFGTTDEDTMRQVLSANGVMISAAHTALQTGICFAPVSGFHHASYAGCGPYCTFNGLLASLMSLKQAGKIETALILDFDGHYGDGTADIIEKLGLYWITHMTRGEPFHNPMVAIKQAVTAIRSKPDIIIYQAGADSHIDDTYMAGYFTTQQWTLRDSLIFNAAYCHKIPIVWNLAGGYSGNTTIALHAWTFHLATKLYEPNRQFVFQDFEEYLGYLELGPEITHQELVTGAATHPQ